MRPATQAANGRYRPEFLSAIDACLKVRHSERPRSVAQLRSMLFDAAPPVKREPEPAKTRQLAAGKSEWMVSAGLGSYLRDDERTYQPGEHLANAVYRLGVTDSLSAETQVKGDDRAVEAGMGLLAATAWGAIGVNTALSASDLGKGAASNVSWDLVNVRGLLGTWVGTRESLRLAAEYRSTWFRSPGGSLISSNGILYPETPYWLRVSGAYSIPVNPTTTASLSARY
jgi:outer membrane usher protein